MSVGLKQKGCKKANWTFAEISANEMHGRNIK